ncbi:sugar ABC transporter ATP-binding protein [Rathayibacter sp. ZW T2_19]|uniref:Sugar ABC transporter ATP-binding protein n=1 Tax=Rathayibacter rubneri TaxID=2950106 RepID=A0A9X2DUY3_9MICO|nr:sugar ABC transporter ATP-binding protein [Rathayibacter rubneri]MCM6760944.1 sugar ABC transporter ATP-binding protein [Rathayibacter rubneri]
MAEPLPSGPALSMRGIGKAFAGVPVLRDVGLELAAGEIVALVGENGAGKSTLIKILTGLHSSDAGSIAIDGAPVAIASPRDAERAGVQVVHQDRHVAGRLSVAEQLFLGRSEGRRGLVSPRALRRRAERELLERVGLALRGDTLVDDLTVAEQQLVQVARALSSGPRVLVLDEPTAPLASEEVEMLFSALRRLAARGTAVVYISHYLQEVRRIASRVVVLRNGANAGEVLLHGAPGELDDVVRLMIGRDVEEFAEGPGRVPAPDADALLELDALSAPGLDPLSLAVRPGEVVGVTGLVGSGVELLADAVAGVVPHGGRVLVGGRRVASARAFVAAGGAYVPSDRRRDGVLVRHTVAENLSLAALGAVSRLGFVSDRPRERALAAEWIRTLDIRPADPDAVVGTLSGGNQQKIALGKWLAAGSRVFVLDSPTAGVDIGARTALYRRIEALVDSGAAVLLISLDLEELVGLSDRVVVLHRGAVRAELPRRAATGDRILALASGADDAPVPQESR